MAIEKERQKLINLFKFFSFILKNIGIAPINVDNPAIVDIISGQIISITSPSNYMLFYLIKFFCDNKYHIIIM